MGAMRKGQCGPCGQRHPTEARDRGRRDCRDCRAIEALRPARGRAPIERALTPPGAKPAIRAACRRLTGTSGILHGVDHVIPARARIRRDSDERVPICGLDIPANRQILPARESGAEWMVLRRSDAKAEEDRSMMLHRATVRRD